MIAGAESKTAIWGGSGGLGENCGGESLRELPRLPSVRIDGDDGKGVWVQAADGVRMSGGGADCRGDAAQEPQRQIARSAVAARGLRVGCQQHAAECRVAARRLRR